MRTIQYQQVVEAVKRLCIEAAHRLPPDVLAALRRSAQTESNPQARHLLELTLENAQIAERQNVPLCQDTGVTVVFVEQGSRLTVEPPAENPDAGLTDAINQGVAAGYADGFLRKSMVADPAGKRVNTGDNTPAVVHHAFVPGDQLKLSVMLKGGGCENRSRLAMLTPAQGAKGVEAFVVDTIRQAGADACPPFVVGVGIGGNFELACLLAKKALLRPIDSAHRNSYYADMERRLLAAANQLNIGPQGMGGDTTALAVLVETHPCHIASLPVAVNIECHSHRHGTVIL